MRERAEVWAGVVKAMAPGMVVEQGGWRRVDHGQAEEVMRVLVEGGSWRVMRQRLDEDHRREQREKFFERRETAQEARVAVEALARDQPEGDWDLEDAQAVRVEVEEWL